MNRSLAQSLTAFAVALTALTAAGCSVEAVGDPCMPESIPVSAGGQGFFQSEIYLETSSVQCRTRVCMINQLACNTTPCPTNVLGNPNRICEDIVPPADASNCVSQAQVDDSIYCTCRCDGPAGSADFCTCPDGFDCKQVLASGGVGIVGSYCIKKK